MLKKIGRFILFICLWTFSINSVQAAITEEGANSLAEKLVPVGSRYLLTTSEAEEYEVKFFHEATSVFYEIEINKLTEQVQELKSWVKDKQGSNLVKLQVADVEAIVLREFPEANIRKIKLDIEGNGSYKVYEAKFGTANIKGEIKINPETGAILEREIKYFQ